MVNVALMAAQGGERLASETSLSDQALPSLAEALPGGELPGALAAQPSD